MTRSELIKEITRQTQVNAEQVKRVIDALTDNIVAELAKGEKVTIAGLGRFEMRRRESKGFTNPKTGARSQLGPACTPGFKVSGRLKDRIMGRELKNRTTRGQGNGK